MRLVLGKEMLTKLTWSHSGSETVKYHWKLLQVALGTYTQVTRVQRVGTPQTSRSFVDAISTLRYSILLHRTILSPVTYPISPPVTIRSIQNLFVRNV